MAKFYKTYFASFVKTKKVHKNIKSHMTNFIQVAFSHVLKVLPTNQLKKDFIANLTIIVHSHRHNNSSLLEISVSSINDSDDQSFSEFDFSIVRDVMYNYSKKAH